MKELVIKWCLILITSSNSWAFLEQPYEPVQDAGYCVWYGQCGAGWNQGKLNCPATEANKNAPLLTDPEGLQILKTYCPALYTGDTTTHTCCSTDQLKTMKGSISLPEALLGGCPACFFNFLNQICQMTCSPHQSKFTWANMSTPYPTSSSSGIPSLTYVLTDRYAQGLFDSCKDVRTLGGAIQALPLMCGHSLETCTPQNWLQFIGSVGNGQAPFPVNYVFSNKEWTSPDGQKLDPLNITNVKCDQKLAVSTSVLGAGKCSCKDCSLLSCTPPPAPTADTRKKYFDAMFGLNNYRTVELIISRIDNRTSIRHELPPPSVDIVMFASEFDKNFLKQVLLLQWEISNLTADNHGQTVSLNDVCAKLPNQQTCVVESVLQYYQNNVTKIDEVAMDEFGFFVLADHFDHFLACSRDPKATADSTKLNMPCGSDFGNVTQPYIVLEGYTDLAYENATGFVMTFVMSRSDEAKLHRWENEFVKFMKTFSNPNMSITYKPRSEVTIQPGGISENDEGHCTWYGQCGPGWNQGVLNCPVTDKTKNAPLLTDPEALTILEKYCPSLHHGPNNTRTCCDLGQLKAIQGNLGLPDQLLSRCPACYSNFLNQICQMTCSPVQSKFLYANMTCPLDHTNSPTCVGIPSVTYIMTDKFATDLYNSCKDVQMPSFNDKAMSVFCGRKAKDCSPRIWLDYMGNTGNGRAAFPINYIFTSDPWVKDNQTFIPLNMTNIRCNETASNATLPCSCEDCSLLSCTPPPAPPAPTADTRKKYFDAMFGLNNYRTVELIISRIDNRTSIRHYLPPPSVDFVMFASEFDKNFLKQVLLLQWEISNLTADNHGQTVSLNDVCAKLPNQQTCVVESVLQYYQNNATKIDEVVMDKFGFFVLADHFSHFLACSLFPKLIVDGTALNMPCGSDFGNVTQPYIVLEGYTDLAYENATGFVMTFVMSRSDEAKLHRWENEFVKFMKTFSNPNMIITYKPRTEVTIQPGGISVMPSDTLAQPGPGYDIVEAYDTPNDATAENDEGHCTWYGQCGPGWNQGVLNCPVTNKTKNAPLLTDPEALTILEKYCPSLHNGPNNTRTCCDLGQLKAIQGNLGLPDQMLSRCPACYTNFLNQICQMTCSPVQSKFLYANMTCPKDHTSSPTCDGIPSVTYIMTDKFATDLYNSCKDVQMPSTNDKAMSVFCGRKAKDCSPRIWLDYMGNTGNGRAPFPINYIYTSDPWVKDNQTFIPLNMTNIRCNETTSNATLPCSCQDCQASCAAVPPLPPPKKPFKILGIDGPVFIMGSVFVVFVIFFGTYVICYNVVSRNSLSVKDGKESFQDSSSIESECCENYSINGSRNNLLNQVSPADIGGFEKLGMRVEDGLRNIFTRWGTVCASYPLIVVIVSLIVFGSLAGGIARYDVTTDPVKLWSSKQSTAREQKDYFDSHFGPFYRTEQIIISRPNNHMKVKHSYPPPSVDYIMFSSLFEKEFMHQVLDLQLAVQNLVVPFKNENITLNDICFKPLAPDNEECTVESVLQFWQNNKTNLDKKVMGPYGFFVVADYLSHFLKCAEAPASVSDNTPLDMSCLGTYGGPAFPWVVVGGYDGMNYQNATALVITYVVNNHLDEKKNAKAEAWEAAFINHMKNYKNENMTVSFSSERSIQDELNRESSSDILTILISYLIMFGYITIALGQFHGLDTILIDSKVTLGVSGVTIVLLSVAASVGFYSYIGVSMTLIIIEVVPFLVLAVGVDNIFILVQTYQRDVRKPSETLEEQIGRVLGAVGPSMLLTSFSESIAFFLGALTDMPAVREFALYAAMAVLFDFLLQITCFVSLMTIDAKRQESNRFDICCCVTLPKKEKQEKSEGYLYWLVNNYYSHALLTQWIRPLVMLVFVGYFFASIAFACHLEVGLDQALSMPKDSFVLDYFRNITAYLSVGAPVYFVVPAGYNYMSRSGQDAVCGSKGCLQDSLMGQVFRSSQLSNYSYIAQPAGSWIDDYFDWVNSGGDPPCCRLNATGAFCPSTSKENCTACPFQPQINGRPTPHDFMKYLPMYLVDNPGLTCAKGGHAAYGAGVNLIKNDTNVGATYFMTYHTPMKTSADYINGLKEARAIAKNISISMNITGDGQEVFPYSIFYVFYEQYLFIVHQTIMNIGICMAAIFVATFILLGFDIVTAIVVCTTILMIVVDIMGMMYLWNITLNALSLVNLVMAIGIAVEFCSHIARAFAISIEPTRVLRAKDALAHMGSSVLSGITLTKLGGIIVLAFAKSQLFEVFYFRMYLGMVVFGATHGLIFLPVFLSYCGPSINKAKLYQYQQSQMKETSKLRKKIEEPPQEQPPQDRYVHL